MALLPDVHVSLDRPTIQHIYQLFLPLVPGGAFVIGLMLARSDLVAYFAVSSGLGYFSRVAAMVFSAYVAGVLLYALSVHFGSLLSVGLAQPIFRNEFPPDWTNSEFDQGENRRGQGPLLSRDFARPW